MDDGNMALAKLQVTESIREYEPRATLNEVSVEKKDTRLDVKVVWSVVATNNPRNGAILGPVVQVIEA
jgi:phage baseplate assembly protein W